MPMNWDFVWWLEADTAEKIGGTLEATNVRMRKVGHQRDLYLR